MAKTQKLELLVTIHETAASIRLGGDGYFITFAGTEKDIDKAVMLAALKKQRLKLTVEIDDSENQNNEGESKTRSGQRDWIGKRRA